jgi:hypothetical protein
MVLPFMIAFFVYDLGFILDWTGLIAFLGTMSGVPLIFLGARKLLKTKSPYERSYVTTNGAAWGVVVLGIVLLIACFILLLMDTMAAA